MGAAQTPPDPVKIIRRRYCNGGWWPATPEIGLLNPHTVRTTRYRYRGTAIPTPWPAHGMNHHVSA
jgi:RNA-directed DNA polymerase